MNPRANKNLVSKVFCVMAFCPKSCNNLLSLMTSSKVMVLNPAFMKYVHQSWLESKGKYPSTGFMTLMAAIHFCDEVCFFVVVLMFCKVSG